MDMFFGQGFDNGDDDESWGVRRWFIQRKDEEWFQRVVHVEMKTLLMGMNNHRESIMEVQREKDEREECDVKIT